MNFTFELFGFCADKDYLITTFWILSFRYCPDDGGTKDVEGSLFLVGKINKKWVFELFCITILGQREEQDLEKREK